MVFEYDLNNYTNSIVYCDKYVDGFYIIGDHIVLLYREETENEEYFWNYYDYNLQTKEIQLLYNQGKGEVLVGYNSTNIFFAKVNDDPNLSFVYPFNKIELSETTEIKNKANLNTGIYNTRIIKNDIRYEIQYVNSYGFNQNYYEYVKIDINTGEKVGSFLFGLFVVKIF